MSGLVGSSEQNSPNAIQVLMQTFRLGGNVEKLKGVLTAESKMTAAGYINGTLAAYEAQTPAKVAECFKKVMFPEGTKIKGGMSSCSKAKVGKWSVKAYLSLTINDRPSNIQVTAVCTLAENKISNLAIEVEPAGPLF